MTASRIIFIFAIVFSSHLSFGQPSNCIHQADKVLDEALALMQKNYYKKDSVDWQSLILTAKNLIHSLTDCDAAYKTVQMCLDRIGEKHSFIMPPLKAEIYSGNINSARPELHNQVIGPLNHSSVEPGIAMIEVPWVSTTDQVICNRFADSLQKIIRYYDQQGITKWIIDLRKNTGGNVWPMLAGLGPLLGEGVHGYFISPKHKIPISYKDGVARQGSQLRSVVPEPYVLSNNSPVIVVLTGPRTASAAEIIAIAFKGLNNVSFYGGATAGLTTANATYPLSDGSMLVLTVCKEADRFGNIIEGKIQPDQVIAVSPGRDEVLETAVMFLQSQ